MPGTRLPTVPEAPPDLPAGACAPADVDERPSQEDPSTAPNAFGAGALPSPPPTEGPDTPPREAAAAPELWAPSIVAHSQHPDGGPTVQVPPDSGQEIPCGGQWWAQPGDDQPPGLPNGEGTYPVPDYTGAPQAGDLEAGGVAPAPDGLPQMPLAVPLPPTPSGSAGFYEQQQQPEILTYQSAYLQHMPSSFQVTLAGVTCMPGWQPGICRPFAAEPIPPTAPCALQRLLTLHALPRPGCSRRRGRRRGRRGAGTASRTPTGRPTWPAGSPAGWPSR